MTARSKAMLVLPALALLFLASAMWLAIPLPCVEAAGDPIVVIVNVANPIDNLGMSDLRKLFLSDRSRWESGKAVAPVIIAAGAPERTAFLKIVCGMNDSDFGRYFVQATFTGKSVTAPREVNSTNGVKVVIANSIGAIGFLKAGDFHGDGSDGGVKAIKIDGIAAGDKGYKLRL